MSPHPAEFILLVLMGVVPLALGYLVVRLAVRHGVMDAQRRLRAEQGPPAQEPPP